MRSFLSALLIVALALGGLGAWLYMEQDDTLTALRMEADRSALGQSVTIDSAPSGFNEPGAESLQNQDTDFDLPDSEQHGGDVSLGLLSEEEPPVDEGPFEQGPSDEGPGDMDTPLPDVDQTETSASERLADLLPLQMDDQADIDRQGDDANDLPPLPGEMQDQDQEPSDAPGLSPIRPEDDAADSDVAALPDPAETPDAAEEEAAEEEAAADEAVEESAVPEPAPAEEPDPEQRPESDSAEEPAAAPEIPADDPADDPPAVPAMPTPENPAIAIVVMDLGQSSAATESAIQRLPGAVTLAFTPYASTLSRWIPQAVAAGHEVLMMVPMEPVSYPRDDPGPQTLLTSLTAETNLGRLDWALERAEGYIGVVNNMGSRMTASSDSIQPILEEIHSRGLLFLDSRTARNTVVPDLASSIGLPVAVNDRFIDRVAARNDIDAQLAELESVARQRGYAVGIAGSYPVTFERLAAWLPTLEDKGIDLVPISQIARGADGLQAGAAQ